MCWPSFGPLGGEADEIEDDSDFDTDTEDDSMSDGSTSIDTDVCSDADETECAEDISAGAGAGAGAGASASAGATSCGGARLGPRPGTGARGTATSDAGAGLGAGSGDDKQRAEAAMDQVRVLSAGRQCWDWHCMLRGHVTSSVANYFLRLAAQIRKCSAATAALRNLLDAAPSRLLNAWHGSRRDRECNHTRGDAAILAAMRGEHYMNSVFEVGLVESVDHVWLAASPDAVGDVRLSTLLTHLRDKFRTTVTPLCETGVSHLPFVFKPVADASAAARATSDQWMACRMGTAEFKEMIPDTGHRCQIIHTAATCAAPAAVFVATTKCTEHVLFKTLVVSDSKVIAEHTRVLSILARELCGWVHTGPEARAPRWMKGVVAQALESHQPLWWATRMEVMNRGPLHPVESIKLAPEVFYNKYVGAQCVEGKTPQ